MSKLQEQQDEDFQDRNSKEDGRELSDDEQTSREEGEGGVNEEMKELKLTIFDLMEDNRILVQNLAERDNLIGKHDKAVEGLQLQLEELERRVQAKENEREQLQKR